MSKQRHIVAFDLDGTLVDSLDDIIDSFRHAFTELGIPSPEAAAVRALVGKPLEEMYGQFAQEQHIPALSAAYRRHYPRNFARRTRIFAGVEKTLEGLRDEGYLLAVATTKRSEMAQALAQAVGLADLVDHIQGTDGFPHKPAPDVLFEVERRLAGKVVWMVGDTPGDIQAGRAAGASTYAVTWGTSTREQLSGTGANLVEPDFDALLPAVRAQQEVESRGLSY